MARPALNGLVRPVPRPGPVTAVEILAKARRDAVLWRQEEEEWRQRQQEAEQRLGKAREDFALWLKESRRETARIRNHEERNAG